MDPLNGNYNDELKEKIRVADYVGVAKYEVYLLAKKLNPDTHFLIEGFDPKWDYPIPSEAKHNVTFIGNPYGDRAKWLDGVTILTNKFNVEHAKAVGESRININLTGGGGPSDRVYKILAARGFCLSQSYPHAEKYGLTPGVDLVFFDTPEEMVDRCNFFLAYPKARDFIAELGYQTVQKFNRDNLAKQIVDVVTQT
jgi:spore maturation protein CgeB